MPVAIRPAAPITEYDVITAPNPDGTTTQYVLHGPQGRAVMSVSGEGMPEIEYVTQRGPFQDGETLLDFHLRPRVIEYHIRQLGCDRNDYWRIRAALLDILRPNRSPTDMLSTITKYRPDGSKRAIRGVIQSGPGFQGKKEGQWDEFNIDEIIRFICFDPTWFDPTQKSVNFNQLGGLTFPITFPITFGASGGSEILTYNGTYKEFPVIFLTGAMSAISIYNANTNERIGLTYNLLTGRGITIDLTYGVKSVTLDDGTSLIGYVTNASDLGTFHLQPGTNNIQVTAAGLDANSNIALTYYERYIGI